MIDRGADEADGFLFVGRPSDMMPAESCSPVLPSGRYSMSTVRVENCWAGDAASCANDRVMPAAVIPATAMPSLSTSRLLAPICCLLAI